MSVKNTLTKHLRESMLIAFPLNFDKYRSQIPKIIHLSQSKPFQNKSASDYFSTTPELIFTKNVKRDEDSGSYEKGFFGLPTGREIAQDLMVQMPDAASEMLQGMEVEQYYHFQEGGESESKLINGHHINFYLKNQFIEDCKSILAPHYYLRLLQIFSQKLFSRG